MLPNIVYASKNNFNLISLGELYKLGILYHDYLNSMVFKQKRSTIRIANRYKNLFILETGLKTKAMFIRKKSQPIYFFNSNPQI